MINSHNNNKAQKKNNKNWHCIKQTIRKDYITRAFDCQAFNNGNLVSHCHEIFYTLGTDVCRRRGMDRGRKSNQIEMDLILID